MNDLNTPRSTLAGVGTLTNALYFGGSDNSAVTEEWNGTSFTETGDLNTGRQQIGGSGIYTSAVAFGGDTGSITGATEEFSAAALSTISFDAS